MGLEILARLALASLATWRLTCLLYWEDGPWRIFLRLRDASRGFPAGLLDCFWCLSVWTGTLCAAASLTAWWWLLMPLAASGGALLMAGGPERMRGMLNGEGLDGD